MMVTDSAVEPAHEIADFPQTQWWICFFRGWLAMSKTFGIFAVEQKFPGTQGSAGVFVQRSRAFK
jgi:hypothetical protein